MMTARHHRDALARSGSMRLPPFGKIRVGSTRLVLSAMSIFAGIVHVVLAGPHLEEARWLGSAFLLDGVVLTGAGIRLLFTQTRGAMRAAGAGAALTALAYVASRTMGLPGMDAEAWDALGLVTTMAELAIVVMWRLLDRSGSEPVAPRGRTMDGRRDA